MQYTHLGVYAWITAAAHVLLIYKGRGPYMGTWDLSGGKIEFGEEPLTALHCEVMEETGMRIEGVELSSVLSHRVCYATSAGDEDLHHLGILYAVRLPEKRAVRIEPDGEDALQAKWFSLADLSSLPLSPFAQYARTQTQGQSCHE